MARIKITLAYDGTEFCGFQFQPGDRTVQGDLERAVSRIAEQPVRVHGAGRTDSGVHALAQVAHFDVPDSKANVDWRRALNKMTPDDVTVIRTKIVGDDFHARFSATGKIYAYTLWTEPRFLLPQRSRYVWGCGPVDLDAMSEAAEILTGTHDFASFQNVGTVVKSTIRTLQPPTYEINGPELVWRFNSNGFLKQMVRNLMGCMVACGRGKVSPQSVRLILDEADRSAAPATAPARGLCLERVFYGENEDAGSEHNMGADSQE